MKIIKVITNKTYEWKGKDGNSRVANYENYFLELDNKKWVAIKPSFASDYAILDIIAVVVDNRGNENEKGK